jgi:hypothetical protein
MAPTSASVRLGSAPSPPARLVMSGVREMGGTLNTRNLRSPALALDARRAAPAAPHLVRLDEVHLSGAGTV